MASTPMESVGNAFVKSLFYMMKFDATPYCKAAIDSAYEYCIQEFKKACEKSDIPWDESWEAILYD